MRKDMRHVVIDKPRRNSGAPNTKERVKHKKQLFEGDAPKHGSKHLTQKHKELSDNLNPLRRYLEKQVGRPWDKVYSDICQNLDKRSTLQAHVFEHIFDFVEKNVTLDEDGTPHHNPRYWGKYLPLNPGDLYICPNSGILKRVKGKKLGWYKRNRLQKKDEPQTSLVLKDGTVFARCGGIWYELDYMLYEVRKVWVWRSDAVPVQENIGNTECGYYSSQAFEYGCDRSLGYSPLRIYPNFDGPEPHIDNIGKVQVALTSRRQLNSDILRKHGLKNDV